ncbi:MAG: hypothetical protein Q8L24_00890 [bacterium]|nr:hypothetical protein [bacterium]
MARLELAVLKFLAKRPDGCQDLVDIFRGVMNPSPVDPGKWQAMCVLIDEMEEVDFVKSRQEKANGHRLMTKIRLTATGWQRIREEGHGS